MVLLIKKKISQFNFKGIPYSNEIQQQLADLKTHINNMNLASNNIATEIHNTVKALLLENTALEKENVELKAKKAE